MITSPFPLLFQPLKVAHTQLANRVIMGSMHTGLEEKKDGEERLAQFYRERAEGGVGLIVTGGISPNRRGWLAPFGSKMSTHSEARKHKLITSAVHETESKICMQILHAGRYGHHPFTVAPSAIRSPISKTTPSALSEKGIRSTIADFAESAALAREAGYDGVEIMGSEGYLINQFLVNRTNQRTDDWGGTFENKMRFPLEIIRATRKLVGEDFILIYRLSMLDLVDDGNSWEEVEQLAKEVEKAGANIINTGIGWHEARIPTIAMMVPRAGFAQVTKRLMGKVNIPLITTNRINSPQVAEQVLADGCADLISMARPFLADPEFVIKAKENRCDEINTCIACNQACLDLIFEQKTATCLVNPRACNETKYPSKITAKQKLKVAVVGAGPAGLSAATEAANLGHDVFLFDKNPEPGGQLNLAKKVAGKEEFYETLRYYSTILKKPNVNTHYNFSVTETTIQENSFDHWILATGVTPKKPPIEGVDHPMVCTYDEVLSGSKSIGNRIVIIGSGGIAVDTARFLKGHHANFYSFWGIDNWVKPENTPNGEPSKPTEVTILSRSDTRPGEALGKTTAWIHRMELKKTGVRYINKINYRKIDSSGVHIIKEGKEECIPCDQVILCTGQQSEDSLIPHLEKNSQTFTVIGGALKAGELNAKRAIEEGLIAARQLSNP
jgi:2,4-dienoyl-CoA reductase (NADPH2)